MKNIAFERMSLRNLNRDDLEPFYTWAGDPEVAKTMTWEAYTSKEDALKFLKEVAERHPWLKAICVDGIPVGSITLTLGKELASQKAGFHFDAHLKDHLLFKGTLRDRLKYTFTLKA